MDLKRLAIISLLAGLPLAHAHAAEPISTDPRIADRPAPAALDKQAPPASIVAVANTAGPARAPGKTRDEVIAEVVQAKKDGSYVVVPEAYPESFHFRAAR